MERIFLAALGGVQKNPWAAVLALLISVSFFWAARERSHLAAQVATKADTGQVNALHRKVMDRLDILQAQNDTTNRMLRRFICRNQPHPDFCS